MKAPELKEELKKRGQPLLRNKGVLVELLLSSLAKKIPVRNGKKPKPKKRYLAHQLSHFLDSELSNMRYLETTHSKEG